MTTPNRSQPARARRGTVKPRPAAASDWGAVEQAAERWGDLRITEADLPRVAAFLETQRARRLHRELVEFQDEIYRGVKALEWGQFDPATLMALVLAAEHLRAARDHGFPPGFEHRPADRWVVLLHWMLLMAEDAKAPVLSLAQQAMTAALTCDGASREIVRRATTHAGFDAAVLPLLQWFGEEALLGSALQHVRRAVKKNVPREAKDDTDSAIMEEIVRRLGPGPDLARAVEAVLAALPAGPRASRWDYFARQTARRLRREVQSRGLAVAGLDEMAEPEDPRPTPDRVAAVRVAALREIARQPGLLAALRAAHSPEQKPGRTGASKRRLAEVRRVIEDLLKP